MHRADSHHANSHLSYGAEPVAQCCDVYPQNAMRLRIPLRSQSTDWTSGAVCKVQGTLTYKCATRELATCMPQKACAAPAGAHRYDIWKYSQITSKADAQVPENLIRCICLYQA